MFEVNADSEARIGWIQAGIIRESDWRAEAYTTGSGLRFFGFGRKKRSGYELSRRPAKSEKS